MAPLKTLMLKPQDHVAVALEPIPAGSEVEVTCENISVSIVLKEAIDFGHKFAVSSIRKGEDILKYGEVIGVANQDIEQGSHVHVHNLDGKRGRGDQIVQPK